MKISFHDSDEDSFKQNLNRRAQDILRHDRVLAQAHYLLWGKLVLYSTFFTLCWMAIILLPASGFADLLVRYLCLGLAALLLSFNVAHDAVHRTFSRHELVNKVIYSLSLGLLGVNAYFWRLRHTASHHVFPNVDGGDVDIEDNTLIRFSRARPCQPYHRYQHLYAPVLYAFFTLYWVLVKDYIYFSKQKIGNLDRLDHKPRELVIMIAWKLGYFSLMILAPILAGHPWPWVLGAWVVMHLLLSLVFVLTLITSHLTLVTEFPLPDTSGKLPWPYFRHQLATSADFYPTSRLANFFWGGFNSHAAHHLFPGYPHTLYPRLSVAVQQTAREEGYPYHEMNFIEAIRSHFLFLKKMGRENAHALPPK